MTPHPGPTDTTLEQAIACHGAGDTEGAHALAERVLAADPGNATALQLLGITAAETGDAALAHDYLTRALAAAPASAMIMFNLGEVCRALDRLPEALGHYAAAADQEPTFVAAHLAAGHATLNAGRPAAEAAAHFRAALAQVPGDAGAIAGLVRALEAEGGLAMAARRPAEAARAYREWLTLQPDHPVALVDLGHALRDQGRLDQAVDHYRHALAIRRGPAAAVDEALPTFHQTAAFKLRHDAEQLDHLAEGGRLPERLTGMAEVFREVADVLPPSGDRQRVFALTDDQRRRIGAAYNRFLVEGPGGRLDGPAIHPDLDTAAVEDAYAADGEVAVVDGLLAPAALEALTRYCRETTFWFDFFHDGGYLGAYLEEGFDCPLLRQIVAELPERLPRIFGGHRLRQMWAYKYDSRLSGIPMHADEARVNLNFWLTPDAANLEPATGGLIVYPKEAPLHWDFRTFNNDQRAIRAFIADAEPVEVAHRRNRAVVFNSDYFHRTGDLHFRPGYENRRINVTMLFGWRDGRAPEDEAP